MPKGRGRLAVTRRSEPNDGNNHPVVALRLWVAGGGLPPAYPQGIWKVTEQTRASLQAVRKYWEQHPLFSLETSAEPGTREFWDEHNRIRAEVEQFSLPLHEFEGHRGELVLDVGCGVGWLCEHFARGGARIVGIDLTEAGVRMTRERLRTFGLSGFAVQADAENLPFRSGLFSFVTSSGVLHHTPNPGAAVAEIHRVLAPGGRAMLSFYYRNFLLSPGMWPLTRWFLKLMSLRVPGRGGLASAGSPEDFVRLYDGDQNPLGMVFTKAELRRLLGCFQIERMQTHYFPKRFLPFGNLLPKWAFAALDRFLGTMMYCKVTKIS